MEIGADGTETPLTHYKHNELVKRQAARFRVFAYDQDSAGNLNLVGEVGADAHVEWTVDLVNRKAALDRTVGPADPRNVGITDRDSLIIRGPQPATIAGTAQPAREVKGTFLGKKVYLGELRTDGDGHLIVLGGRGASGSVPPGLPLETFISSDRWHDDVSDGPVTATVTLPGQRPAVVREQAWVVVAPAGFRATGRTHRVALRHRVSGGDLQGGTPTGGPAIVYPPHQTDDRTPGGLALG